VDEVRVVRAGDRRTAAADQTAGIARREAFSEPGFWMGVSAIPVGAETGWHHHGDHESYVYVLDGSIRVEFGAGGASAVDVVAGDFAHIPSHLVHRELAPGGGAAVVVRSGGSGPAVVNVDGPASGGA
jgi:uncharacterized RmlC-like cupin family protein